MAACTALRALVLVPSAARDTDSARARPFCTSMPVVRVGVRVRVRVSVRVRLGPGLGLALYTSNHLR